MRLKGWKAELMGWTLAFAIPLAVLPVGAFSQTPQQPQSVDVPPVTSGYGAPQDQYEQQPANVPPEGDAQQANVPPVSESAANEGVARVSVVDGQVSMQRGDAAGWQTATVNLPLMNGDQISTGNDSRAEIQLDYADILRLSENAQVNLVALGNDKILIQVAAGTVDYALGPNGTATVEVDTPNMAVHPQGVGVYRIQVNSESSTSVIVRQGQAQITTPQGSTDVDQGQMIQVEGTDQPQYQIVDAPAEDAFDQWNDSRDQTIQQAKSWNYTDQYYTGSADLDSYGNWTNAPGYGNVWVPDQGAGWSPYADGNWTWEPYWGWTWVSYEPWGWAPYHYGRWFLWNDSWAWWPGPITPYYYPMWAPAYVSFFGWGRGFGVGFGFGFGSIGWLPIGPGDFFHPWWGRGIGYGTFGLGAGLRAGFGGIAPLGPLGARGMGSNLGRMMTDARMRASINSMGANRFGGAGGIAHGNVSMADLRGAQGFRGTLPAVPSNASLRGNSRMVSGPARAGATHFYGASSHAAIGARTSFSAERAQVSRSLEPGNARGGAGVAARGSFAAGADRGAAGSGWQRFSAQGRGEAAGASNARGAGNAEARGETSASGRAGWQSFSNNGNRGESSTNRGNDAAGSRGANGNGWQRFTPNGGNNAGSRPALNMNRSIVTPRNQSAPRGGSYGGASRGAAPSARGGGGRGRMLGENFSGSTRGNNSFYNDENRSSGASRSYSAPRNYSSGGYSGGGMNSARSSSGGSFSSGRSFSSSGRSFSSGGGHSFSGGGHGGGHGR